MKNNSQPGATILQIVFFLMLIGNTLFSATTIEQTGEVSHLITDFIFILIQVLLIYFFKKYNYNVAVFFTKGKTRKSQIIEKVIWAIFAIACIFIIVKALM